MFALVSSVALFDACSSSSGTKARQPSTAASRPSNLVRWRQCLVRHGATLPAKHPIKPTFTRAQLVRALRKNKALRLKFAAALLKAPPGFAKASQKARYERAAQACVKPGALAVR